MLSRVLRTMLLVCAMALLAACESDAERAQEHYDSAVELYEAGDSDRALVELRNVLRLDESHREGRLLLARIEEERGARSAAMRNYLRLVEQYPDVLEAQVALAKTAALFQDWEQASRHGRLAEELAPDDTDVRAVMAVLGYRDALIADDPESRGEIVATVEELLAERPDSPILLTVLVDDRSRNGDFREALEQVDAALAVEPEVHGLHLTRLGLLRELGDEPQIEAQLRAMIELFPEDDELKAALIRFLMDIDDVEGAEAFFRSIADPAAADIDRYIAFVQFLLDTRGPEAAMAELAEAAPESSDPFTLRALLAGLAFDNGETEAAMDGLRAVIAEGPPAAQAADLKIALASMLLATGDRPAAEALNTEVLEEMPEHPAALRMRAAWLIEADRAEAAINDLRKVLEFDASDIDAMLLLSSAYSRNGSHELALDELARAVNASSNAAAPSLRYAGVLATRDLWTTAERVLVSALRNDPANVAILAQLGQGYLEEGDLSRAKGVEDRLNSIGSPEAVEIAQRINLARLARANENEELVATLESMAGAGATDARAMLIRVRLGEGDIEGALRIAEAGVENNPDSAEARITLAATRAATGDLAGAVSIYRDMIGGDMADGRVYRLLVSALGRDGDVDGARAALAEGRDAFPEDPQLIWMDASLREQDGDIDGAIALYEDLYAQNSASLIVANNLASLLATYKAEDSEAVERAFTIARRLRGAENPAFQDTYGWILYLRGAPDEALDYLRPAAAALQADPIVQYHLGMALLANGETGAAAEQLRRALEIAGPDDTRDQFETARNTLGTLPADGAGTEAQ